MAVGDNGRLKDGVYIKREDRQDLIDDWTEVVW